MENVLSPDNLEIRTHIFKCAAEIAKQQRKVLPTITDSTPIMGSGFDSLCLAILVAQLDDEYELNPFDSHHASMPKTFGGLVQLYVDAKAKVVS